MTQTEQIKKVLKTAKHYKQVAEETGYPIPSVRRVLGQGALKGIFERVSGGTYKVIK